MKAPATWHAVGVTYIPIPSGSASNYAGLLTLEIPAGTFNKPCKVTARQITNLFEPIRTRRLPTRQGASTSSQRF